jgi:hypothetical protein
MDFDYLPPPANTSKITIEDWTRPSPIQTLDLIERLVKLEAAVAHIQQVQAEHASMAAVAHVAGELKAAGTALHQAAGLMKEAGMGRQAGDTYRAGLRALKAAEELTGG